MKIIFLDHFGVMCLADKHGIENNFDSLPRLNEMRIHGSYDNFDTKAVSVLNSILDSDTNIELVTSSDWKKWSNIDDMGRFYLSQGIKKGPLDFTPCVIEKNLTIQGQRSAEIHKWLKDKHINNWVAIDDLYLKELKNFVWISKTDEGITQQGIKEQILQYLKS